MNLSARLGEGKSPVFQLKVPVRLLGKSLAAGISGGRREPVAFQLGSSLQWGPSWRVRYQLGKQSTPILLIKTSLGRWGTAGSSIRTALEIDLRTLAARFTVRLKPRIRDLTLRGNDAKRRDALHMYETIASGPLRSGEACGALRPDGIIARQLQQDPEWVLLTENDVASAVSSAATTGRSSPVWASVGAGTGSLIGSWWRDISNGREQPNSDTRYNDDGNPALLRTNGKTIGKTVRRFAGSLIRRSWGGRGEETGRRALAERCVVEAFPPSPASCPAAPFQTSAVRRGSERSLVGRLLEKTMRGGGFRLLSAKGRRWRHPRHSESDIKSLQIESFSDERGVEGRGKGVSEAGLIPVSSKSWGKEGGREGCQVAACVEEGMWSNVIGGDLESGRRGDGGPKENCSGGAEGRGGGFCVHLHNSLRLGPGVMVKLRWGVRLPAEVSLGGAGCSFGCDPRLLRWPKVRLDKIGLIWMTNRRTGRHLVCSHCASHPALRECAPSGIKMAELAHAYARTRLERQVALREMTAKAVGQLKAVTLAQWMVESGHGNSRLAAHHNNYGGLKWRKDMAPVAIPVRYAAHDGQDTYCSFDTHADFITGFWQFLERTPFRGWQAETAAFGPGTLSSSSSAAGGQSEALCRSFLDAIHRRGYAEDPHYVAKVMQHLPHARTLLLKAGVEC